MKKPLITLDNVSIGYNNQPVLCGVSFSIDRGNFTAILGANGSGKSTLLKTMLGLLPPLTGRMETAAGGKPPGFGYVAQSIHFDPLYLVTGFDVALMGAYGRIRPGRFVPSAERDFTRECLRATGALEFSEERFAELSGGQKQRILIARALCTRPDVLVLDEPMAGVDRETTRAVMEFISRLQKERDLAVLLVTHDFSAVRHHAEKVLWIHEGKAIFGVVDELLTIKRMAEMLETGVE